MMKGGRLLAAVQCSAVQSFQSLWAWPGDSSEGGAAQAATPLVASRLPAEIAGCELQCGGAGPRRAVIASPNRFWGSGTLRRVEPSLALTWS